MSMDNNLIFEKYNTQTKRFVLETSIANYYKQNPLEQIYDLYKYDIECIEELIEEGMLGDAVGAVKGGLQKATEFVKNKGLEMFLALLKKIATPEDLKGIEQLKDPEKLKELAAQGIQTLNSVQAPQQEASPTNNESVYSNKRFFAGKILTESNIVKMLEEYNFVNGQILTEAKTYETDFDKKKRLAAKAQSKVKAPAKVKASAPVAQKQQRGGGSLTTYARQVASELKNRYSKSPQQLQNGLKDFQRILTTQLGSTPSKGGSSARAAVSSMPQRPASVMTPAAQQQQASGGTSQRPASAMSSASTRQTQQPQAVGGAGAAPQTNVSAPPAQKEGLIRKAINWVKSNPKRTAGTVLGIIAAIGLAIGGPMVLIPLLVKAGLGSTLVGAAGGAVAGAGVAAAKNIASQGFSDQEFSGKKLATSMGKGAALGAVGGAAKGMFDHNDVSTDTEQDTSTEVEDQQDQGDTEEGGDADYTGGTNDTASQDQGDTEEGGDSDYTGGHPEVDADQFKQFNKSTFDPNSKMDQAKKLLMQKLSDNNAGQIPTNKYNDLASKVGVLLKQGLKPDQIAQKLVGESSYTAGYLMYF